MLRPPRVQFAGAIYHLMNRGVRGEDLYTDGREHAHFPHLCKRAEDWPRSSYRAMMGKEPMPTFLTSDWLLAELASAWNKLA